VSENFRKSQIGQQTVFASPDLGEEDVGETLAETQRAVQAIARALTEARIHPAAAYNALLNIWHSIAMVVDPAGIERALDTMKEFHRAFLVQMADA